MNNLLKGYKKYFIICFVATNLQVLFYLRIPLLIARIVNDGILSQNRSLIIKIGMEMIFIALLAMFFGIVCTMTATKAAQGVGTNARMRAFNKILFFSASNIDHFSTASLVTRLTSDTIALQKAFYTIGYQLLFALLMVIFSLFYLLSINKTIALVMLISVTLFLICITIILKISLPKFAKLQEETEHLNLVIRENTISQRVIKAFDKQDLENRKLNSPNQQLTRLLTSALGSFLLLFPFSNLLMYLSTILILWFGGKMTSNGVLGIGDLTASLSYTLQIFGSLITFSTALSEIGKAIVALKRIFEVTKTVSTIKDNGKINSITNGGFSFKKVAFEYTEEKQEILSAIDWEISSSQFVGIIGSTGEGKSTLMKLLLRLYEPTRGEVYINKIKSSDYCLASLRKDISVVFQDNQLFTGTIKENIKWGKPNASIEEIIHVCKQAQAHEFIMRMPDQYDTVITQGGTNLSGGQRQRICIARALIKQAQIYVFDDSMSALDTITERKIQEVIHKNYSNATIIMISQKISSIINADTILVMDGGKIIGQGIHKKLLSENEVYQQIYASQN